MKQFGWPNTIVTDRPRSYGAAVKKIGIADRQETGRCLNNLALAKPHRRRCMLWGQDAQ
jgi:putative transposase